MITGVQLEQNFDAIVVKTGGVLNAGNEGSESALAGIRHGIGSRHVQRTEYCFFQVQNLVQVIKHLTSQLETEKTMKRSE